MKHFLIKYQFQAESAHEWHQEIARFIEALEADPVLSGKVSYRSMKGKGSDYYHLASAVDDHAIKALGERDFFDRYTDRTDFVSGGTVEVVPLEIIAETKHVA